MKPTPNDVIQPEDEVNTDELGEELELEEGEDSLAAARREQVHLELGGQYGFAGRHERQGGVAARAVGHRGHHACVEQPVLLHEVLAEGEADVHLARCDSFDGRAEEPHPLAESIKPLRVLLEGGFVPVVASLAACLTKPVRPSQLLDALVTVFALMGKMQ